LKKTLRLKENGDGIYQIETFYLNRPEYACCYMVLEEDEIAIIDTSTNKAVNFILNALEELNISRNQVKYIILSHIHLDHAGGAGKLMALLPNAKILLHQLGIPHMVDPSVLTELVKMFYGEKMYNEQYGSLVPIPSGRIMAIKDGSHISIGARVLSIIETPGHSNDHISIYDKKSKSIFTGDAFGFSYPRLTKGTFKFVFQGSPPPQFDPDTMIRTYDKIEALNPSKVFLTHFSILENITETKNKLSQWIKYFKFKSNQRYNDGYSGIRLIEILIEDIWNFIDKKMLDGRGFGLTTEERDFLHIDMNVNAKGFQNYIERSSSYQR
jgi:glyoxylase-like metal-dependent hydrolase (beta-lactamase superfamily II)